MNRCTLLGGNGPINLTVPVVGGRNQRSVFRDVKISVSENWQSRHWKTISSCYNKSPWFDHYRDSLEQLYSRKYDFLIDWNLGCFEWIYDKMSISTQWSLSDRFDKEYNKNQYIDLRGELMPASINKKFPGLERYPQVFEDRFGFVPNLSVLDYLFCVGAK